MDGWMMPYLVMTAGADGRLASEALLCKICTKLRLRMGTLGVRLVTFVAHPPISAFELVLLK